MKHVVASACLLVTTAAAAHAQAGKPLTLESMNQNVSIRDLHFSPDGTRLALVSNKTGRNRIWTMRSDGSDPRVLVADEGSESSPRWSPDGRRVAFIRGQDGQSDIWVVDASGGVPHRITNDAGGERALRWAPDGTRIAFISDRAKSQDVYVVTLATGKVDQVTRQTNPWDEFRWEPCWSPDGRAIAYVSNRSEPYADDLWLADLDANRSRKLTADLHVMSTPIWSPDGRFIAFNAVRRAEFWYGDMSDIYLVSVPAFEVRKLSLNTYVSDGNGNVKMSWAADSKSIFFRYEWEGDSNVWNAPVQGGVATKVTYQAGSMGDIAVSPDGKSIAFIRSTPLSGGEVFRVDTSGGEPRQLTAWFQAYQGVRAPERVSFRSTDGKYILGYLYLPKDFDASRKYPSLVQVHGGGNNANGNGFHLLENFLAESGYVVLAVEYRGSSGHGREFQDLALGEWAADQGWDAVAAANYLRSRASSNGKVGIYGGSYGGIMTMAALTRDSSPFQAAAPLYGIFDWENAFEHGDRLMQFWIVEGHFGFKPGENPKLYEHTASLRHLDKVDRTLPFLIIHGEKDRRAPFEQSQRLVAALKGRGNPVEFYSYPEEEHGFRLPKNRTHAYGHLLDFFNRHLR